MISLADIFFFLKSIQNKHLWWYTLNKIMYLCFYSISTTKRVGATLISSISPKSQRYSGSPKFKTPCIIIIPKSLIHFWSCPDSGLPLWLWEKWELGQHRCFQFGEWGSQCACIFFWLIRIMGICFPAFSLPMINIYMVVGLYICFMLIPAPTPIHIKIFCRISFFSLLRNFLGGKCYKGWS